MENKGHQPRKRKFVYGAVVLFMLMQVSCGRIDLYQNLAEEDANEMIVLLNANGIKATKEKDVKQNEVFWKISVNEKDMGRARALLMQHNLPRHKELGLTGVYKDKGLIPTPDEQKARYLLAVKGEIVNSLERIPSVIDADVVLNVPSKDEFASAEEKMSKRPTASVIVKLKPSETGGEQTITEAKIQQFVANAVEGMNQRDVAVVISYISPEDFTIRPGETKTLLPNREEDKTPTPVMEKEMVGLKLDEASKERLKIYLLVFFFILAILSSGLIISIVQASRMRKKLLELQQSEGKNLPAIEGQVMDEGPPRLGGGGGKAQL